MSRASWWPRCPWKTPEADGEIITYGCAAEPVAGQTGTCRCADAETLAEECDVDLTCSFDLTCPVDATCDFERDSCFEAAGAVDCSAAHRALLCPSAWTSTSCLPQSVL